MRKNYTSPTTTTLRAMLPQALLAASGKDGFVIDNEKEVPDQGAKQNPFWEQEEEEETTTWSNKLGTD